MHIIAIPGSLRKGSYNRMLAYALPMIAPTGMTIEVVEVGELPLFNADLEQHFPPGAQAFKEKVEKADGVIFITPEYNRSIPGVLKNAIDWASRPYGQNAFKNKVVLVSGVSTGKIGTALAQSHLKQVLSYLETDTLGQPELYLGPAKEFLSEEGKLTNDSTKKYLSDALLTLQARITRNSTS